MTWIAQSAPADLDWTDFLDFGVIALVLYLLVFSSKLHTSSEVRRLEQQVEAERAGREKAEAEAERLHRLVEESVIPAISRSTDLIARSMAERQQEISERDKERRERQQEREERDRRDRWPS